MKAGKPSSRLRHSNWLSAVALEQQRMSLALTDSPKSSSSNSAWQNRSLVTGVTVFFGRLAQPLRLSLRGESMKKLNKVAMLFASAALAAPGVFAQTVDNWRAGDGPQWKNGSAVQSWRH